MLGVDKVKKWGGLLLPLGMTVFFMSRSSLVKKIDSKYRRIKNHHLQIYLKSHEGAVLHSCLDPKNSVDYYYDLYSAMVDVIYQLEHRGFLRKQDGRILFRLLKEGALEDFVRKVNNISITTLNGQALAQKNLLRALAQDMVFGEVTMVEELYRKALQQNSFELRSYTFLAKFYHKNCRLDEAINTLLRLASMAQNSNRKINFSHNYKSLADLYMKQRDRENALVNYINGLMLLDLKDVDRDKAQILVGIGDIMLMRGNYFEAISYYKYALSLKRFTKVFRVETLLKLSRAYYQYGNYSDGLHFSLEAVDRAKKMGNRLLYSKAKYLQCLHLEYHPDSYPKNESFGGGNIVKNVCIQALKEAQKHQEEVNDLESHLNLAQMLNFSNYIRDPAAALDHLQMALGLVRHEMDVYRKTELLEMMAYIKIYTAAKDEARELYRQLDQLYQQHNLEVGCCNSLLQGFGEESHDVSAAENYYRRAEKELKNSRHQLATLYVYMADFYGNSKNYSLALVYAQKALEISFQIYRFNHHYICHAASKYDSYVRQQMGLEKYPSPFSYAYF